MMGPSSELAAPMAHYRVLHSGGLCVRYQPSLSSQSTGEVIAAGTVIETRDTFFDEENNAYAQMLNGGWIVVRKGALVACEKVEAPPKVTAGEWLYEVVNPQGMRFAKTTDISKASHRNEQVHACGTIIKGVEKVVPPETSSVQVNVVRLENGIGYLFEDFKTGEVLDRLGEELLVLHAPSEENADHRSVRNFYARVCAEEGAVVLTTPIEKSAVVTQLQAGTYIKCSERMTSLAAHKPEFFRLADKTGWVLASLMGQTIAEEVPAPVDEPYSSWYRIVYQGGVRLRRSPDMNDSVLEASLPLGCFVKTMRRFKYADSETTFLQLEGCVGARSRVDNSWIFDRSGVIVAAEPVEEPLVTSHPGMVAMVLYPGGIALRGSSHLHATKGSALSGPIIVKAYECKSVQGIVSTADNKESYALLPGGAWLPMKSSDGSEVAVRVPSMPICKTGMFELITLKECPTQSAPYPDAPALDQTIPPDIIVQCNLTVTYAALDITYLKVFNAQNSAPAVWIKRDDQLASVREIV